MKRLLFIIAAVLLFSCEKPQEPIIVEKTNVIFWTSEESITTPQCRGWYLWVDGVDLGVIPKPYAINTTDQIPTCGDKQFLNLTLSEGRHEYHMTLSIPAQPGQNYFVSQTYYFDVTAGGCTVVRCTQ